MHPKTFLLAVTLEWIRVPLHLAGMITGKSSWGRRGLIVETAPGIHPGFTGCLTLELTNVGEIPIAISPGSEYASFFYINSKTLYQTYQKVNLWGKDNQCYRKSNQINTHVIL